MTQPSEYYDDATAIATRVMYELTGRRWVWPAITTTEFVDLNPWPNVISLQGRPVIEVISVVRTFDDGTAVEQPYVLENGYRIRLTEYRQLSQTVVLGGDPDFIASQYITQGSLISPAQFGQYFAVIPPRRIAVAYTYGSRPPAEIGWAIEVLAKEIQLAMNDDEDCRLPQRITSISRQGISISALPPESFLVSGYTGIPEVDQAIRNFNPGRAKRPARVYSASNPPPRRTGTTQAPS